MANRASPFLPTEGHRLLHAWSFAILLAVKTHIVDSRHIGAYSGHDLGVDMQVEKALFTWSLHCLILGFSVLLLRALTRVAHDHRQYDETKSRPALWLGHSGGRLCAWSLPSYWINTSLVWTHEIGLEREKGLGRRSWAGEKKNKFVQLHSTSRNPVDLEWIQSLRHWQMSQSEITIWTIAQSKCASNRFKCFWIQYNRFKIWIQCRTQSCEGIFDSMDRWTLWLDTEKDAYWIRIHVLCLLKYNFLMLTLH